MAIKKYPIGTKVVFIANKNMCYEAQQDDGKIGKVVKDNSYGLARIFLPDSVKGRNAGFWNTKWKNIKPVIVKGQQLLFSFMED